MGFTKILGRGESTTSVETLVWKLKIMDNTAYIKAIFVNDETRAVCETCQKQSSEGVL